MDINDFEIETLDADGEKKLLGVFNWFLRGEMRNAILTSKLVSHEIKKRRESGERITREEADKIKFAYDPIFKQRVINKVHRDCDRKYSNRVRQCEHNIGSLEREKASEIKRIEDSRWEVICGEKLKCNITEGKLLLNGTIVLFSSIKGAEMNVSESYRTETSETGKSKKHASVGGAVVGGLMFGAVGAIVGGTALGKTTHKGNVYSKNIPTANHLGVIVNVDGFKSEIVLLNETVDQNSNEFRNAKEKAQIIISKMQYLSTVPVPVSFPSVEEEKTVIELQNKINNAYTELEVAKLDVPTYEIPKRYL